MEKIGDQKIDSNGVLVELIEIVGKTRYWQEVKQEIPGKKE